MTTTVFPYEAVAVKKYKSPHKNDLSFAKGDSIRVTSLAPKDEDEDDEDDEDDDQWLVGETLDGSKTGTFPASHVIAAPASKAAVEEAPVVAETNLPATTDTVPTIPVAEADAASSTTVAALEDAAEAKTDGAEEPIAPQADVNAEDPSKATDETPTSTTAAEIAPAATALPTSAKPAENASPGKAAPERKLSGPPPAAPKPSGLAARIAAFNKPQEAPPPLPRGKPGGWKPPPPAPGAPKPVLPGLSAAQLSKSARPAPATSPPAVEARSPGETTASDDQLSGATGTGFSAADAQSSIKMSLKERMAALQRNEASAAAPQRDASSKPAAPPKPGRIGEDRRAAALASTGGGGEAKTSKPVETADEESDGKDDGLTAPSAEDDGSIIEPSSTAEEKADDNADEVVGAGGEDEEKTEEELESERRAAIAKRMAALGGRRVGAGPGPAMFGAPLPPKARKQSTDERPAEVIQSENGAPSITDEPTTALPSEETEQAVAAKSEQTLAVPRRTAPPRRKKGTQSSQSTTDSARQDSKDSGKVDAVSPAAVEGEAEPAATESDTPNATGTALAAGAAVGAGTGAAIATAKDDEPLTDEPASTQEAEGDVAAREEIDGPSPPIVLEPGEDVEETNELDEQEVGTASKPIPARQATQDSLASGRSAPSSGLYASSFEDGESFEPSTPVPLSVLEDHARQLEAFVRTPENEVAQSIVASRKSSVDPTGIAATAATAASGVDREAVSSPPPPSGAPPLPPTSRPGSTRPPIPTSSLQPSSDNQTVLDRVISPPPSRAPPIPGKAAARRPSLAPSASGVPQHQDEPKDEEESTQPSILAAPKPRMAVPADASDDEDEFAEEEAMEGVEKEIQAPVAEEGEEDTATAPVEAEPQDEEDEERLRRRRLAERMAKMGGQPIMGAPMPFRKRTVPAAEPEAEPEEVEAPAEEGAEENAVDDEGEEANDLASSHEKIAVSPIAAPLSPAPMATAPPIPTKSPPPPMRSPPDAAKRSSMSFGDSGEMARSGSVRSRPPVPSVTHSRQGTGEDDDEGAFSAAPPARVLSPPALPYSPPPMPPSRAPPPRRQGSTSSASAPRRQGSTSSTSAPQQHDEYSAAPNEDERRASRTSIPPANVQRQSSVRSARASGAGLVGLPPSAPSTRDLDLMPSSVWWRHGRPVKLPPTLMRPDVVRMVTTQDEGTRHLIRITIIYDDYSSTAVTVLYVDDDAAEAQTEIAQQHNFPPHAPSTNELQAWSQQLGSRIARQAAAVLGSKGQAAVGDGTSRGFVAALVEQATHNEALPPIGSSFGATILAQAATTAVEQGADDIRPGDVVALFGADLKGKRGLTSYHVTFGSANEPAYACVMDVTTSDSSKKRKLRCIMVPSTAASGGGRGSKSGGGGSGNAAEEVSLRLDDVKSGLLRVFRVAPRQGWLPA